MFYIFWDKDCKKKFLLIGGLWLFFISPRWCIGNEQLFLIGIIGSDICITKQAKLLCLCLCVCVCECVSGCVCVLMSALHEHEQKICNYWIPAIIGMKNLYRLRISLLFKKGFQLKSSSKNHNIPSYKVCSKRKSEIKTAWWRATS